MSHHSTKENPDKKASAKGIRKSVLKGTTTVLVIASLLTGIAFPGQEDINEEQAAASYRPAPVVMDVSELINAPVDDDADDEDEQKKQNIGFIARFRQILQSMPAPVKIIVITPLWAIGTALMTLISFLWNILFASPLGAFIASLAVGFAVLFGLFTATAKVFFPDIPIRKLLSKQTLLILGSAALVLSCFDAAAPLYWHQYPLAAALLKLILGGTVVGVLCMKTRKLLSKFPV